MDTTSNFELVILHRRERGRHQQLTDVGADNLAVRLRFFARAAIQAGRTERSPFFLAVRQRLPTQEDKSSSWLIRDQRCEKPACLMPWVLPQFSVMLQSLQHAGSRPGTAR